MNISKCSVKSPMALIRWIKLFSYFTTIFIILILVSVDNRLIFTENGSRILDQFKQKIIGYEEVSVYSYDDLWSFGIGAFRGLMNNREYSSIDLQILQENQYKLYTGLKEDKNPYVKAILKSSEWEGKSLKAEVRFKGDRKIHKEAPDKMSYRIKLKKDNRLFGLKKFSIQRPILRGYTWEYLLADSMSDQGIATLKYKLVNFSVNGDDRGLYLIEEVPGARTLELQSLKSGPIFGTNEDYSDKLDAPVEVYNKKKWSDKEVYKYAFSALNIQLKSLLSGKPIDENLFDLKQWADFFALNDLFGTYHATVPKSIRYYFNPVKGKFQPILFDGHKGAGKFNQFTLMDFLISPSTAKCDWICDQKMFYLGFLSNPKFREIYFNSLEEFSSKEYISKLRRRYEEKFEEIDFDFYKRLSPNDRILSRGHSFYLFKFNEIVKRGKLIKKQLSSLKFERGNWLDEHKKTENQFSFDSLIVDNVNVAKISDFTFKGEILSFSKPTILWLSGRTSLEGVSDSNKLYIKGPLMVIQDGGSIKFKNVFIDSPKSFKIKNRQWSGAVNIINSQAKIDKLTITSNQSEDALNLVNSTFEIGMIEFKDTLSDAIDFDFSSGSIQRALCSEIGNDCLDGSESTVLIDNVSASGVKDKVISSGENSKFIVKTVKLSNSGIGLVAKDGSMLNVENLSFYNVPLLISSFNKKSEYESPSINVKKIEFLKVSSDTQILASQDSNVNIITSLPIERLSSSKIKKLMYGNEYGRKTEK